MGIKEFAVMQTAELQTNSHFIAVKDIQPKIMKIAYLVFLVVAGTSFVPQYRKLHIVDCSYLSSNLSEMRRSN